MFEHIATPKPLKRLGRTTYVVVSSGGETAHLRETVLHEIPTGNRPIFVLNGREVRLRPIQLKTRSLFTPSGLPIGEVANLPADLLAIDTAIAQMALSQEPTSPYRGAVLSLLRDAFNNQLLHFEAEPGWMRFLLGDDGQLRPGEVAISADDARRLLQKVFQNGRLLKEQIVRRIAEEMSAVNQALFSLLLAQLEDVDTRTSDIPLRYAALLDGAEVFFLRYPNASATSAEVKKLRVYFGAPSNAIFMRPDELVARHQGDCDGDRGFIVIMDAAGPSRPLHWRDIARSARKSTLADFMRQEPAPNDDPLRVAHDASIRGQYIGLLTYSCIWSLGYAAMKVAKAWGYDDPQDVWPEVLGFSTPFIEGVMDARKGQDGPPLAEHILAAFAGQLSISSLIQALPVCDEGEVSDKKFTKAQLKRLEELLRLLSHGEDTFVLQEPSLYPNKTVLAGVIRRARGAFAEELLSCIPEEFDWARATFDQLVGRMPRPK